MPIYIPIWRIKDKSKSKTSRLQMLIYIPIWRIKDRFSGVFSSLDNIFTFQYGGLRTVAKYSAKASDYNLHSNMED